MKRNIPTQRLIHALTSALAYFPNKATNKVGKDFVEFFNRPWTYRRYRDLHQTVEAALFGEFILFRSYGEERSWYATRRGDLIAAFNLPERRSATVLEVKLKENVVEVTGVGAWKAQIVDQHTRTFGQVSLGECHFDLMLFAEMGAILTPKGEIPQKVLAWRDEIRSNSFGLLQVMAYTEKSGDGCLWVWANGLKCVSMDVARQFALDINSSLKATIFPVRYHFFISTGQYIGTSEQIVCLREGHFPRIGCCELSPETLDFAQNLAAVVAR